MAFVACTSQERAPDSAAAGASAAAAQSAAPSAGASASALAGPPATAALPGQLTKPLDQYSGDEFYEFVQRLQWGGGVDRDRKCKGNPECDGTQPARRTLVRVDAVNGQDSLSAAAAGPNGVVAVRAQNRGTLVEDRYSLKPDRRIEYYFLVLPGAGPNGRWQLEELDTTPGSRRHTTVGSGVFRACNHPFRPGRVNRANFYTCTTSPAADSVQRSGLVMFDPGTDPVWVDCAQGCCIAD
jgi:hypothetical protein